MTLAVCMITRGPAGRVASVLGHVRPYVDEVVVAADAAGDPALEALRAVLADDVAWFESPGALEGVLLWALRRCRADWILRIDDDEVPAPELLTEVRALDGDEATHALVPRRWLWPDADAWWASPPLGQDLQLRVLRNMPGLWRQGPAPHDPIVVLGPQRVLAAPLYHADLLLRDEPERRVKAAAYEAMAPGHRLEDVPTNALYVPEDFVGLETAPVDTGHRDAIAAVVGRAQVESAGIAPDPAPAVVLLSVATRPSLDGAAQGAVRVVRPPGQLAAGLAHQFVVEVVNRSPVAWPGEHAADSPIRVGVAWQDHGELPRLLLPASVPPGGTSRLRLIVTAPQAPGRHRLTLRLVHENVTWFGEEESVDFEVVAPTGPSPPYRARSASNGT